ncbi:UDP-N-acetylglucosamine--N-acetylmuramyl-(pentapeptide) pyrophosphoryl-undecaprenol N-acetylglucosamine transferase [Gammaproteobacteria bacterium]|nr:UDP-N-acetylglucosamine--N-acetylmuramyl-(pentapeptide) pyrophosphoryl-undecaprenol N-acetylglucosamine transferase [Gammaproteobacteria bacterium]
MKFLISAAGTGGHIFPALQFCSACIQDSHQVIWIGTKEGMESQKVPEHNIPFLTVPMSGFKGKSFVKKIASIFGLGLSSIKGVIYILRNQINCVVCFGGYISLPIGIAAIICCKPLILHEQNAVLGSSNKLLQRFAKVVFLGMPLVTPHTNKMKVVGNPIEKNLQSFSAFNSNNSGSLRIYITGGSLGSEFINQHVPLALSALDIPMEIQHQAGRNKAEGIEKLYSSNISVEISEFYKQPSQNILWSDFVICRAGALTLSEVTSLNRGCLMIPLPSAIDNHQLENARQIQDLGLGIIHEESESTSNLEEKLKKIIDQKKYLSWQSGKKTIDHFQASERMLSSILQI